MLKQQIIFSHYVNTNDP